MQVWNRRLAVVVLVGASFAPTSAMAATAAAVTGTAGRSVHAERRASQEGILPAAFSFFKTLVEKALTSVSPAPVPGGPRTSANPSGDNGAGIDPNGR
jgi:hypothetical protein